MSIRLECGAWTATVTPETGGSLANLRYGGVDILRSAGPGASYAKEMACFPMVPYVNRIDGGRFAHEGQIHRLPLNFVHVPDHSLHGLGWQSAWSVEAADTSSVTISHHHSGGEGWPFAYRAVQQARLEEHGLSLTLSVTNTDAVSMPASLGLHPYFPIGAASRLGFGSTRMWLNDARGLPTEAVSPERLGDWRSGGRIHDNGWIDNVYDGWSGVAALEQPGLRITLSSSAPILHVFTPGQSDFLCLEPSTAMPNAVNRPEVQVLEPGETLSIKMRISAEPI